MTTPVSRNVVILGIVLVIVFLSTFVFAINSNTFKKTKEVESIQSAKLSSYNEGSQKGSDVLRFLDTNHRNYVIAVRTFKQDKPEVYGHEYTVEPELSEACGYPSLLGKNYLDSINDDVHWARNRGSDTYISDRAYYKSYHICNESKEIIGVYFLQE